MKKVLSIKRLGKSFGFAFKGFGEVIKNEPNMKIHILVAILVIIMGFLLKVSVLEWIFLVFAIGLVIGAEILNTSFEKMVDLVCHDYDKQGGSIKDTAAAYVMILAFTASIIGLIIFVPKIISLLKG